MYEKQPGKFHTDDVALEIRVLSLIGCCQTLNFPAKVTTNEKLRTASSVFFG